MGAVWKFRGLTLLLRVGILWRCGDGLFFEVPPLASDALLTTLHPLLENVLLPSVDHFKISYLGASFSCIEKPKNLMGRDLDCMVDVLMGFHRSTFSKPNTELCKLLTTVNVKSICVNLKITTEIITSLWEYLCFFAMYDTSRFEALTFWDAFSWCLKSEKT
jgi:hypothetical protein